MFLIKKKVKTLLIIFFLAVTTIQIITLFRKCKKQNLNYTLKTIDQLKKLQQQQRKLMQKSCQMLLQTSNINFYDPRNRRKFFWEHYPLRKCLCIFCLHIVINSIVRFFVLLFFVFRTAFVIENAMKICIAVQQCEIVNVQ